MGKVRRKRNVQRAKDPYPTTATATATTTTTDTTPPPTTPTATTTTTEGREEDFLHETAEKENEKQIGHTRGAILQRQKLEYKALRENIRDLKKKRQKLNRRDLEQKKDKKKITKNIKDLLMELKTRQEQELNSFDQQQQQEQQTQQTQQTQQDPHKENDQ